MAVRTGSPGQKSARPTSNKQVPRKKIIKILLDSGSDGDLLFQKKARKVPKSWHTSNEFSKQRGKGKSK